MRALKAHRKAQRQSRQAQEDGTQPPAEPQTGEHGRDWDEGSAEFQNRQAQLAAAREQRQRLTDYERGHWSADVNGSVGVTRL